MVLAVRYLDGHGPHDLLHCVIEVTGVRSNKLHAALLTGR
jgi:hypothetical protein